MLPFISRENSAAPLQRQLATERFVGTVEQTPHSQSLNCSFNISSKLFLLLTLHWVGKGFPIHRLLRMLNMISASSDHSIGLFEIRLFRLVGSSDRSIESTQFDWLFFCTEIQ